MKLSDFNNPNRIEVTETYPFLHTNVYEQMTSHNITRHTLQKLQLLRKDGLVEEM